jgi:hypothetical protein
MPEKIVVHPRAGKRQPTGAGSILDHELPVAKVSDIHRVKHGGNREIFNEEKSLKKLQVLYLSLDKNIFFHTKKIKRWYNVPLSGRYGPRSSKGRRPF